MQVGEVGPGTKIRTGAHHDLIRSASLSLLGLRRQSRPGSRTGPPCCHPLREPKTAVLGPAAAGPGRAGKAPARPRPLAAPTSSAPALRKWSGGQGTEGGWEEGRRRAVPLRAARPAPAAPPPPFAPPARPGPPQPAGGLTCVADDDVLEEIGVRHGRGRSVPGSRLLLPLCASSAPSPAPLGREPGPRPPSAAVRASSKDPRGKRDELTAPSADRSGPALRNNNSRGASAPPPRRPGSAAAAGAAGGEGRIRGRARRSEPRLPRSPAHPQPRPPAGRSGGTGAGWGSAAVVFRLTGGGEGVRCGATQSGGSNPGMSLSRNTMLFGCSYTYVKTKANLYESSSRCPCARTADHDAKRCVVCTYMA